MAHRIAYKPTGTMLSSQIGDIPIHVDGTFVDVRLTSIGTTMLSERYYAYSGSVTLYDLGSLIENDMRTSGTPYGEYTLALLNAAGAVVDSHTLKVLYCDRYTVCTDTAAFLAENFLTTLQHRRVAPGDTASLFFFADSGEDCTARIALHWRCPGYAKGIEIHRGTLQSLTADSAGVRQLDVSLPRLTAYMADLYKVRAHDIEIVYYTVSIGQRSITFYVDPSLDGKADAFAFRNVFNVWDVAYIPGVTKAKTDVERSTAVINTGSRFYNQRVSQTFAVETGPLTSDEAEWIDQLCTSHLVMRVEANGCSGDEPFLLVPILITDSDCEVSDTDEKPNTVKFTWRYEDNRPIVRLSASPGIFTSPYNIVYS